MDQRTRFLKYEAQWMRAMWGVALLVVWVFLSNIARASAYEDVKAGSLFFQSAGAEPVEAMRMESELDLAVTGLSVRASLKQVFENKSEDWVEGVYVFPLPEEAAIDQLKMTIGERVIQGEIKAKPEAEKMYQQAKQKGQKASVIHQQRPNLFTSKVANIGPGERVVIEIAYQQVLHYEEGGFSLRFPMTLTPRYIPGAVAESAKIQTTGWALSTDQVPDAAEITPYMTRESELSDAANKIAIKMTIDAGLILSDVSSPYHDIAVSREGKRYHVSLPEGPVLMDRDFVVRWQPTTGHAPEAAFFPGRIDNEYFGLLMVMPPQAKQSEVLETTLPKQTVFIIDTSGSMAGASLTQAKAALALAIEQLQTFDQFNVIEFNSNAHALFPNPRGADAPNKSVALNFVAGLKSDGGTEMASALALAFADNEKETESSVEGPRVKQIIFITDGSVGNEKALFKMIQDRLGEARLFTVGIGSAPNSYFMSRAAEFGRGSYTYIGSVDEVQSKMQSLFSKINRPVLTNIKVDLEGLEAVEYFPRQFPDLYQGEPVVVVMKLPQPINHIAISGGSRLIGASQSQGRQQWRREIDVRNAWSAPLPTNQTNKEMDVAALWARAKIKALMNEQVSSGKTDQNKTEIIALALKHKMVSRYTSLVAVEQQISRMPEENVRTKNIPNQMPKGSLQALPVTNAGVNTMGYPNTAAGLSERIVFGMLLVLTSMVLYFLLLKLGLHTYGNGRWAHE